MEVLSTEDSERGIRGKDIISIDEEAWFVARFCDGYSFRNTIEYIRTGGDQGYFVFHEDHIRYTWPDGSNTVLNDIIIDTSELVEYYWESKTGPIYVGIKLDSLRSITRSIRKKDSVKIYKKAGEAVMYVQVLSGSSSSDNLGTVRIMECNGYTKYEVPLSDDDEKNPNCVVSSTEFSNMCAGMGSVKCDFVKVVPYPGGVNFMADKGRGLSTRLFSFGSSSNTPLPDIDLSCLVVPESRPTIVLEDDSAGISTIIIKSVGKLSSLCPMGTIKIFADEGGPIKLVGHIGSFAKVRVYIKLKRSD